MAQGTAPPLVRRKPHRSQTPQLCARHLLLLLAFSTGWRGASSQNCVLRFDVNPALSNFTISGQVTKPLPAPITGAAGQVVNASGPLYIALSTPPTACPPLDWSNVTLDGATFVPPPITNPSPLTIFPPDIVTLIQTLATVTISDLTVNLTSLPVNATVTAPATNTQAVTVNQSWVVGNALAAVAIAGGTPSLSDLGGASTSVLGDGTLTSSGSTATLDFPNIAVSFTLTGSTAATIVFTGGLQLTSTLGCPSACNSNGQCLLGTTPESPGTCACDCGFSGVSCASQISPPLVLSSAAVDGGTQVVVTGLGLGDQVLAAANNVSVPPVQVSVGSLNCSSLTRLGPNNVTCNASSSPLGSKLTVTANQGCRTSLRSTKTIVTLTTPTVLNPPVAILAPAPVSGGVLNPANCPQDLGYECAGYPSTAVVNGTCDCACKEGWGGQSCNICKTDAACSLVGYSQCDQSNLFGLNTTVKNYDCLITDPNLQNIVDAGVTMAINVSSGTVTVAFRGADTYSTPVNCTAYGCTVSPGTTAWHCDRTRCDCGDAAVACRTGTTVQGLVSQISGSADFKCTGNSGTDCTLIVVGFPVNIAATCTATECSNGSSIPVLETKGTNWAAIGSSLGAVAAVLLIGIVVGRWGRLRYRAKKEQQYLAWMAYKEQVLGAHANGGEGVPGVFPPAGEQMDFADAPVVLARELVVENLSVAKGESFFRRVALSLLGNRRSAKLRDYLPWFSPPRSRSLIVSNVSLRLESGSMLAIMGPTGSGKTTLLNTLAGIGGGRTAGTTLYGRITIDGLIRDSGYRYLAAYLPQEDFLYSVLTVEETVRYAALLRLPAYMPKRLKMQKVDAIIEYLGLARVRNDRVGGTFGRPGLSGGERRRVRIAMELVSDPQIVLLDEPTSGLDSHTAARLVRLLHDTARKGSIIVLSVHQPSQATFEEFDQVLLMSKRGRVVYFGPQRDIYSYFDQLGHPCAPGRNFADHMLQVVSESGEFDDPKWVPPHALTQAASRKYSDTNGSAGIPSVEHPPLAHPLAPPPLTSSILRTSSLTPLMIEGASDQKPRPNPPPTNNLLSPIFKSFKRRKNKQASVPPEERTLQTSLTGPDFQRSMITELGVLYGREITNIVRNPALLGLHLLVSICMALLSGGVFQNVTDDIAGIQNRSGAFLFSIAFFSLASLSALEAFITERIIFTQEGSGKYYRTLSYYLPKITLDALFLRILPAVVYTCIMYWLMGLRADGAKFLMFLVVMAMVAMIAGEVCSCISLVTASVGVANFISIVVILLMLLFTGALVNSDKITHSLRWLLKLSFLNYAYEVLLTSQVEGLTILFQPTGFPKPVPVKGDVVLSTLGLHSDRRNQDTWVLFAMVIGFLLLAWLLLILRVTQATRLRVHKDRKAETPDSPPTEEMHSNGNV